MLFVGAVSMVRRIPSIRLSLSTDGSAIPGNLVDRILHQQKAERELLAARQAEAQKEEQEALPVPPGGDPFAKPTPVRATRPASTATASDASETSTMVQSDNGPTFKPATRTPTSQMLDSFKNRFGRQGTGSGLAGLLGGERDGPSTQTPPRNEQAGVTPTTDIGALHTLD